MLISFPVTGDETDLHAVPGVSKSLVINTNRFHLFAALGAGCSPLLVALHRVVNL